MASQCPQELQLDSPNLAEGLAGNLYELQNQSAGKSQVSQDWRWFSNKIEDLAIGLQALAHFGDGESVTIEKSNVSQLIQLTNELGPSMNEFDDIFAAVGPPSDVVCIESRSYASAHHAAFGEACFILRRNGPSLHQVDWMEDTLDPSGIIKDWDHASNAIAERLSMTWRDDFKVIPARIRRERAAIERAESHSGWQTVTPSRHGDANQRGAWNELANGQRIPNAVVALPANGVDEKKSQPEPETVEVIEMIQRKMTYEQISEATGKSIDNIRTIRSRLKRGKYVVKRDTA